MTNLEITNAYVGNTQVEKIYLGTDVVWGGSEPEPIYSAMPLTFNIISAGTILWRAQNTAYTTTIEYSLDSGETWTSITSNTGDSAPSISVNAGDVVRFRGDNATYATGTSRYNCFCGSTAIFEAKGNIMSLIYSTGFETATTLTDTYAFLNLFRGCAGLTSAENLVLPATTLANYCYDYMFYGCTSLTTAPELPATTLANYCYRHMFNGCRSLVTAPTLPATTLATSCYSNMFNSCTSLTTAPELPATTLAKFCYSSMFNGCTSLTQAPALLATTLTESCYQYMFGSCTSLTTAPELPATTLARSCYSNMFRNCTSLNYIKCLAADISANSCTSYWVSGVASSGTFVKHPDATWPTGEDGIPEGWTVIDEATPVGPTAHTASVLLDESVAIDLTETAPDIYEMTFTEPYTSLTLYYDNEVVTASTLTISVDGIEQITETDYEVADINTDTYGFSSINSISFNATSNDVYIDFTP